MKKKKKNRFPVVTSRKCLICCKLHLHSAAVTLFSRVQQAVPAGRGHGDGLHGAGRLGQTVGLSSSHEIRQLLHTAVTEEFWERQIPGTEGGARPYILHTHLCIHRCIDSRVCSNLSLSAITQLEVLYDRPHVHPGASWDSPKLCPISWAMVEASPMGLSWWSCKNTTAVLNCRSPPGWVKVGLDSSHLVDSAWVLRAHGELIC